MSGKLVADKAEETLVKAFEEPMLTSYQQYLDIFNNFKAHFLPIYIM